MEEREKYFFDHEKLNAYKKAVQFAGWTDKLIKEKKLKVSTTDQLERAAESIVLNIAEGNGKFTSKDKCRYFDIARGSAMESAGCLDVLLAKNLIGTNENYEGKIILNEIVKLLMGLIKSNSDRVYEPFNDLGDNSIS